MVADKRCWKLHPLSLNCAAAGAGTSADLDHITRECYYQVQLWFSTSSPHSSSLQSVGNNPLCTNTTLGMLPKVSVRQICRYLQHRLYEQGGACQANLIVGGVEENGQGILRAIHPDGSMDVLTYSALGSGSLAAMGILENVIQDDRHNLSIEDAIQLVVKAVKAGIDHDLGSGSQVDLCIITQDGIANYTRSYLPEETLDDEEAVLLTADIATTTTSETSSNGINGFGNIPYVVRSKRVIQNSSQRCKDEVTRELWKEILPE
jgi:20S proteasome subunit beta 2